MKIAEVKNPSEEKPVEKPKFDNPRMNAVCMEFDWRLENGDVKGAFQEVSGCRGNGSRTLVAYAIKRLDAAGAATQADALRKEWVDPVADAKPSPTAISADIREMFRRFSRP